MSDWNVDDPGVAARAARQISPQEQKQNLADLILEQRDKIVSLQSELAAAKAEIESLRKKAECDCCGYKGQDLPTYRGILRNEHPAVVTLANLKQQARPVRNYRNPNEVFEAIPLSCFGKESKS